MTWRHLFPFPGSFVHKHTYLTTQMNKHTLPTPLSCGISWVSTPRVLWCSPVEEYMFCLWSVTCTSTVGLNWMWALSQEIRAVCVGVCVFGSWLVGRHQYRWGLQMWWVSWLGLLLSSWFSIMRSPPAAIRTNAASPRQHQSPLCLLVPVENTTAKTALHRLKRLVALVLIRSFFFNHEISSDAAAF